MIYATVEQANEYHAARLSGSAWSALQPAQLEPALQSASDTLDAYAAEHGGWLEDWEEVGVPEQLKNACCMLALELNNTGMQERILAQRQGVSSIGIGSASESYTGKGANAFSMLSPIVISLLRPFVKHSGHGVVIV